MLLPEKYESLVSELRQLSGPVIRYRIDRDILEKKNIDIEDYLEPSDEKINYWLTVHQKYRIHGSKDCMFENAAGKLLEFGFTNKNEKFKAAFAYIRDDLNWKNNRLNQIVIYPFLVRAGYLCDADVNGFFLDRIDKITDALSRFGYDFQERQIPGQDKFKDSFIIKAGLDDYPLPSIYDIYAWAFRGKTPVQNDDKIERIISYALDDRFQRIPEKAYMCDSEKKRYFAAGSVYHACLKKERKLLNAYLFSHFKSAAKYPFLLNEIKYLMSLKNDRGFYSFDSSILKERKDSYFLYSGAHMGLAEKPNGGLGPSLESTFWMLKIILNLHVNGISID